MVKLMRGGKNQPRGEMHFPRGRGFPRFPIQPPPMRGQHMPLRSHNHFSRPPLPYRPPLPPCPRGRPFLGPIPPSQFAHKHPLPPLGMGPLTPRSGLPIGPEGGSYPPRLIGPPHSIPPGPSRGPYVPLGSSYNNTRQPFRQIRKPGPVKRVGVMNGKTKQKSKRKSKPKERSEEAEINKPWMTEKLKVEISKKHKLYHEAKELNTEEGWAKYTEQRTLVGKISNAAKLEYIGSHPDADIEKIMFGGRPKTVLT